MKTYRKNIEVKYGEYFKYLEGTVYVPSRLKDGEWAKEDLFSLAHEFGHAHYNDQTTFVPHNAASVAACLGEELRAWEYGQKWFTKHSKEYVRYWNFAKRCFATYVDAAEC